MTSTEAPQYRFDLEAAKATLAKNPLHIDRALNDGFRSHEVQIELPGLDQAKRDMFKFFEEELLNTENLSDFKTTIENPKLGLSKNSQTQVQRAIRPRKAEDMIEELDGVLKQIDLVIRRTMIDKYYNPIAKLIDENKDRVHKILKAFHGYHIPGEDEPDFSVEKAVETCKIQVKEGFTNMVSIFLGLVRVIPRILERKGENLSEQDFVKVVHNLKNLMRRYASSHVLKLRIFRNYVGFDDQSERIAKLDGMGTSRCPVHKNKPDETPDLYHFHDDLFEIIDTEDGKQLVNNEKTLDEYKSFVEENKIRGKTVDPESKSTIKDIMEQMHTTPTLGCPLGRVRFDDGQNFIEVVFNWMDALVNQYYLPAARNQGLFKPKRTEAKAVGSTKSSSRVRKPSRARKSKTKKKRKK